jgi:hypothetical protein
MGRAELHIAVARTLNASLWNMTWLTHWGMTRYHAFTTWQPSTRPGKARGRARRQARCGGRAPALGEFDAT